MFPISRFFISLAGARFGNKRTLTGRPCTFALNHSISRHFKLLEAGTCITRLIPFPLNCVGSCYHLIHPCLTLLSRAASWYRPATTTGPHRTFSGDKTSCSRGLQHSAAHCCVIQRHVHVFPKQPNGNGAAAEARNLHAL